MPAQQTKRRNEPGRRQYSTGTMSGGAPAIFSPALRFRVLAGLRTLVLFEHDPLKVALFLIELAPGKVADSHTGSTHSRRHHSRTLRCCFLQHGI